MTSASTADRDVILIVEDDEDSRYVYRIILEDDGFEVLTATCAPDGLRLARERHPRVILMDISIPGMDGWETTQVLKEDPATADIPVIILTAHAFPEDLERAEKAGCDGFLTKPCEPRRVLEEVRRLVDA